MLPNVIFMLGRALIVLSFGMFMTAIVAVIKFDEQWLSAFLFSAVLTVSLGGALNLASSGFIVRDKERRDAIVFGVVFWIVCCPFAALPIYFGGGTPSFSAAIFEAMSGLTTTGATVLSDLQHHHQSLILWRALLQWYGGLATIVFAVSLLSNLGIAGIGASQSHLPRGDEYNIYRRLVRALTVVTPVYVVMTAGAAISMLLVGVTPFEAVVHAMTALSTGGFSTRDGGLAAFDNPVFSAVVLFWCCVGAINFTLHWALFHGRTGIFLWDAETGMVVRITVVAALIVCLMAVLAGEVITLSGVLTWCALVVSAITTSGFVVVPEAASVPLWMALFLALLMLIGPATGSTAGGFKVLKVHLLFRLVKREVVRLPNPRSVQLVQYAGARVDDRFMRAIWVMFGLYVFTLVIGTLAMAITGLTLDNALSVTMTSLANAGGFYGRVLAADGSHGVLSDSGLLIMTGVMMLGRLELLAVLTMFSPAFWRS